MRVCVRACMRVSVSIFVSVCVLVLVSVSVSDFLSVIVFVCESVSMTQRHRETARERGKGRQTERETE